MLGTVATCHPIHCCAPSADPRSNRHLGSVICAEIGGSQVHEITQVVCRQFGHPLLTGAKHPIGEVAFGRDELIDSLLDGSCANQLVDEHVALLPDAIGSVSRLILDGGVPPPVEMDDM